ncbi:MAG: DUF3429 domain-containing protein [Rhodobacteraceae bacterium]|nr:MAG: DUF3429 domain-containing protein [Paracoccaceae bacterium]
MTIRAALVTPPAARALGYAGLIPFVGLAGVTLVGPDEWRLLAQGALAQYGAIILSFMGGCRWGFAAAGMGRGPVFAPLALSVLPALYAWGVLVAAAPPLNLAMLAAGLAALLAADLALVRAGGAPRWWPTLRWPLTLVAGASLLAGSFA